MKGALKQLEQTRVARAKEAEREPGKPKPLSEAEHMAYRDLKGMVRRDLGAFVRVGAALAQIRDKRLYREEYGTFEDFCQAECQWTRQRAYQLIAATEVVEEVRVNNVDSLPLHESHARELGRVPEGERTEVWSKVLEVAPETPDGDPIITAGLVAEVVGRHLEPPAPKAPRGPKLPMPLGPAPRSKPKKKAEPLASQPRRDTAADDYEPPEPKGGEDHEPGSSTSEEERAAIDEGEPERNQASAEGAGADGAADHRQRPADQQQYLAGSPESESEAESSPTEEGREDSGSAEAVSQVATTPHPSVGEKLIADARLDALLKAESALATAASFRGLGMAAVQDAHDKVRGVIRMLRAAALATRTTPHKET